MNNEVGLEGRPRPLSAGLWTFFSWLRRDERSDSSESLSSAGSDRTVASFSFLSPARYERATAPLVLPPPGPPTDSYKRRVLDRNLRHQYERDITLHRKYGLFKNGNGETSRGYDAFSLPPARKINSESGSIWERERRATSECFQRRSVHVPGKRRAPLPPVPEISTALPASLTRRSTRKRRAPQPPVNLNVKNKENINHEEIHRIITVQMNQENENFENNNVTMGHKSEKYSKKEEVRSKNKRDKNFLKQIFDSKKRNSGIDVASIKLLPSISELDKQAAEIIKNCKSNSSEHHNNINTVLEKMESQRAGQSGNRICVSCLRKYNSATCLYCFPKQKTMVPICDTDESISKYKALDSCTQTEKKIPPSIPFNNTAEEKQKLKEMLKEMKDSLPKRAKNDLNVQNSMKIMDGSRSKPTSSYSTETPTLRVGSTIQNDNMISLSGNKESISSFIKPASPQILPVTRSQIPITVQPISMVSNKDCSNIVMEKKDANVKNNAILCSVTNIQNVIQTKVQNTEASEQANAKKNIHVPLKISSLLNPVYVPKKLDVLNQQQITNTSQNGLKTAKQNILGEWVANTKNASRTANNVTKSSISTSRVNETPEIFNKLEIKKENKIQHSLTEQSGSSQINTSIAVMNKDKSELKNDKKVIMHSTSSKYQSVMKDTQDQYSKRRTLIQQLEQSIAKGDEQAAAEAASKLAQLRLSCSVLSFSSQILSQPSTSAASSRIVTDNAVLNILPSQNLLSDSNLEKVPQGIQVNPVKEVSSQKVFNITSSTDKVENNVSLTPTSKVESCTPLKKNNSSVIKDTSFELKKDGLSTNDEMTTIAVMVEDREATRGPVHLLLRRRALMKDLRREAEASLGVAANLQRWIVGRVLCVNDDTPVATLGGPNFSAPFYLCVVESEANIAPTSQTKVKNLNNLKNDSHDKIGDVYTELVELEQQAYVPNADNFECGICMEECPPGRGIVLRECVHVFCRECMSDMVRHCEEPDVVCPAVGCQGILQEREIRALVTPQEYERWLARGLAAAESGIRNAFHCRTRDCKGWVFCEPGVQRFPCPVCKRINCVLCQTIHDGETCEQHKAKIEQEAAGKSSKDDGTQTLLNSMIAKGEALKCPECSAIITKKWGCDWVKCSACKTEICWVTRGRRWGPGGKGDTSGGCRCGVDGKRCHPSCNYCH